MVIRLRVFIFFAIIFFCAFLSFAFADDSQNTAAIQQLALEESHTHPEPQLSSDVPDATSSIDEDKNWEYTQSVKYSRGKYGTSQESETYEEDSILQRNFNNADISVTIPSLWQTGNVTATEDGKEIINKKTVKTVSTSTITPEVTGLGDIAFNANYYLLEEDKNAPLDVTLTSYLKAPTASSSRGLGTGEWDGGPGVGFTKKIIANIKAIADASYTFDGKVSEGNTRNQTSLDGGLEYDITPKVTTIVKYEYANSTSKGTPDSEDIYLSLEYKLNDDWKINGETTFGLTKGSPQQTYLLGASVSFNTGMLGIFPALPPGFLHSSQDQSGMGPFDPISTRLISDPLFLPLKGQFYGTTSYTYSQASYDSYNYNKSTKNHSKTDTNTFTQTTAYGVSDRLTLRVSDSYAFDREDKALSTTGAITSSNNKGFNNPTLGTEYRLIDQTNAPVDLDLTFNTSPNAFKSKQAGGGNDGSVASGDQPIAIIAGLGREMNAFSIEGTFQTSYVGNKYYQSLASNQYFLEHEYFNYVFGMTTQTRITDRFSVNLGTGYTVSDNTKYTNLSTGTQFYSNTNNTLDFTSAINYQFIPNRLVGGLTYTYNIYTDNKINYPTALTSDSQIKNHDSNVFGARVQYLF